MEEELKLDYYKYMIELNKKNIKGKHKKNMHLDIKVSSI